jgi:hypothetical protein
MLCSERHQVRRSHTRRTRTPRGLLGRDCTSGQVLLRFSHFTLHTPHLTPHTHLSLWPYPLKTTTADQRIAVWSDSCDVAVDIRKPLAAAILLLCWPEMFRQACSDCFKRKKILHPLSVGRAGAWMRSRSSSSQLRVNYG